MEKIKIYIYIYIYIQHSASYGFQIKATGLKIQNIFVLPQVVTVPSDMETNDELFMEFFFTPNFIWILQNTL